MRPSRSVAASAQARRAPAQETCACRSAHPCICEAQIYRVCTAIDDTHETKRERRRLPPPLRTTTRRSARPAPHRHRVLLVEDDLESREALKEYLRLEGLQVAAADDGEAALATLRAGFAPCVILLDMHMPGVD